MAQYVYIYVNHAHLNNWNAWSCYFTTAVFKWLLQWSDGLYSASLLLLG